MFTARPTSYFFGTVYMEGCELQRLSVRNHTFIRAWVKDTEFGKGSRLLLRFRLHLGTLLFVTFCQTVLVLLTLCLAVGVMKNVTLNPAILLLTFSMIIGAGAYPVSFWFEVRKSKSFLVKLLQLQSFATV